MWPRSFSQIQNVPILIKTNKNDGSAHIQTNNHQNQSYQKSYATRKYTKKSNLVLYDSQYFPQEILRSKTTNLNTIPNASTQFGLIIKNQT